MKVTELSRDELSELKQSYVTEREQSPSWGDLASADSIPDETIFKAFAGIEFVKDDFFCDITD